MIYTGYISNTRS